jgi:hypothetical protein
MEEMTKAVATKANCSSFSIIEAELNAAVGRKLSSDIVMYSLCDIACISAVTRYIKDCLLLDRKLWNFYNHAKMELHLSGYVLCSPQTQLPVVKEMHPVCIHWSEINWKPITADYSVNKTVLKVASWQKSASLWSVSHKSAPFVGFVRREDNEKMLPVIRLMANDAQKPVAIVVLNSGKRYPLALHADCVSDIDVPTYSTPQDPNLDSFAKEIFFQLEPEPGTRRAMEFDMDCCYYAPPMYK